MRSRRASVGAVLERVLGRTTSRPVRLPAAASSADAVNCAHLFERGEGGRRCKFCGTPSPFARVRRQGEPHVRLAVPEKDVQFAVIHLFCLVGCCYEKTGLHSDIYVLGTRRPRHLAAAAHRTHQTPGIGDLFIFLPAPRWPVPGTPSPPCVWFEVKADDGKPSPAQLAFQERCLSRGIAHVMGGVDAARSFLNRFGFLKGGE